MELEELSFEQALAELEHVISQLEQGGIPLEEALALYARGQALLACCQQRLETAQLRVRELTSSGSVPADDIQTGE